MSFVARHLQTAVILIQQFTGEMPLHLFLKGYFAAHKKFGSKDRKQITHLCYCYYRAGNAFHAIETERKIKYSLFLCEQNPGIWASLFDANWLNHWNADMTKRIDFVQQQIPSFRLTDIFPLINEISKDIDQQAFAVSHLSQPDLFLRIRPGFETVVANKLTKAALPFRIIQSNCIVMNNAAKMDELLLLNKEVVVQDYASQQIAGFLKLVAASITTQNKQQSFKVWDCCAASGGKSILAYDVFEKMSLTVSDIRSSIIHNLHKRLADAGISHYHSFITDLSVKQKNNGSKFQLIICDAPCSGSGTWGRTPEQLTFFKEDQLVHYASLQKKIVGNALECLEDEGCFLYITCSVFEKENEQVAAYILQQGLQLVKQDVIIGYTKKADTMFAALFKKKVN